MRLHRLQVTAFGPFAETETVDFDRLAEGGLFLLHGATGAGKSSVLDAVCFALYGRLPGRRGTARPHLASDHAAEGARPQVQLELTLGGRRFEVTRSPEWRRPKRRGTGTTPERAGATLREWRAGGWHVVSTRADEVGHELQGLLGMRLDQFTTVVLLPQGEFEAFLRADAESRRGLLEQLFATGRFSDVETWLAGRRRDLGREVAQVRAVAATILARADEHTAPLAGLPEQPGTGSDLDRLRGLAAQAARAAGQAAVDAEAAAAAAEVSATRLTAAAALADHQARRATLDAAAAELSAGRADQEVRRERLARARRAAPLLPHLRAIARLTGEVERADAALDVARLAVPAATSALGRAALEGERTRLAKELGRLDEARSVVEELDQTRVAREQARGEQRAATRAAAAARAEVEQTAARHTARLARVDQLKAALARRPAAEALRQEWERVGKALGARAGLATEIAAADAVVLARAEQAVRHKQTWLDLRERRLAGMAAELAGTLADGERCVVCGSLEHPAPAQAEEAAPSRAAEQAAQDATFEADQALASAREHQVALTAALAEQAERSGAHRESDVADGLASARSDLAEAAAAEAELAGAAADLAALAGQQAELATLAADHDAAAARAKAVAEVAATRIRQLSARLAAYQGDDADVPTRVARLEDGVVAIDALLAAWDHQVGLSGHLVAAVHEGQTACAEAGFTDVTDAAANALPVSEAESLAADTTRYDESLATVTSQLAETVLLDAAAQPAPDLAALQTLASAASAARRNAEVGHARLEQARGALHRLASELTSHQARHERLLAESELVDGLARCVEGTGGDNALRMRLSSYVLAARLEQVAAAATERLLAMSDGRYSLVHSDALAKGGGRSGLSLRVVDGWTGVERDTATLSGGECFLASLSLALGLADAVQAEAGGAVMQTLFVDEGFGMLDEDTLDEVMAVLDGLREGGRQVGIVSHVPELRQRVLSQLEVRKTRGGSRLVQPEVAQRGVA